jgi:c-di-GMP-binding flagellar brake protein YcgR
VGLREVILSLTPDLAPKVLKFARQIAWERVCVNPKTAAVERRRWPRLPLAIPVFVRSRLEQDKEFLEFATALNVSAGGMLVAVRRSLPASVEISLEIPSAPLAALAALPKAARTLRAKVLRSEHADTYNLVGLKFVRPLVESRTKVKVSRRKHSSLV